MRRFPRFVVPGVLLASLLAGGSAMAEGNTDLLEPPQADYSKVCVQEKVVSPKLPANLTLETVGRFSTNDRDMLSLAQLYLNGDARTPANPVLANKLLEKLTKKTGPLQAQAEFLLGKNYIDGEGVTQDSDLGVTLLKSAVLKRTSSSGFALGQYFEQQGNFTEAGEDYRRGALLNDPESMFALANLYKQQRIDLPTPDAAETVLKLGQDTVLERLGRGDCESAKHLGYFYWQGEGIYHNERLATRWYEIAVNANNPDTMLMLAKLYQKQATDAAGRKKVFDLWKRAADLGSNKAMYKLGQTYIFGEYAARDFAAGVHYLEESAIRQNVEAMRMLYHFYRGDFGAAPDYPKAFAWLVKAVEHPNAIAKSAFELAEMYEEGLGTPRDFAQAYRYYAQASRMGSDKAPVQMAMYTQVGLSVAPQPRYALRFYRLAASRGDKDAMTALYNNYRCGVAVPYDEKAAQRWLERAFTNESSDSIATLYDQYMNLPGDENHKKAIDYLQRGVDFDDRKSMIKLATLYHTGAGVPKDEAKAKALLEQSVSPGKHKKDGESALSDAYFEGIVVPYDPKKAVALLKDASQLGSPEAARKLGRLLLVNKHGIPLDPALAYRYLEKGAIEGDTMAMAALARHYRSIGTPEAQAEALRWYELAAEKGDSASAMALVQTYTQGTWLPKDAAKAELWQRVATAPYSCDIEKSITIARSYHDGGSFAKDDAQARAWFDRALRNLPTEISDIKRLALAYAAGYGYAPDFVKAAHWYEQAANLGDKFSMRQLATYYLNGEGVDKSTSKALDWLNKAAKLNDPAALIQLSILYDQGVFVHKDEDKAEDYLKQAAKIGSPTAMRRLGFRALLAKDYDSAVKWYTDAANINDLTAVFALVKLYADPTLSVHDEAKSKQWLDRAMVLANGRADGMYKVGNAYYRGFGVKQDYAVARDWFVKSAALGNSRAMHHLGRIYQKGYGVPVDMPQAISWYERAAALGDAGAMTELGIAYANGDGVERDYARAFGYLNSAAGKGASKAMRQLGYLYMRGAGTKRDEVRGMDWVKQAAEHDDVHAMEEVAQGYSAGYGFKESPASAVLWWKRAAAAGSAHAKHQLETAVKTGYAPASSLNP